MRQVMLDPTLATVTVEERYKVTTKDKDSDLYCTVSCLYIAFEFGSLCEHGLVSCSQDVPHPTLREVSRGRGQALRAEAG